MGNRLSHEQLQLIKEKLGVDKLWSFSKVGTFDQCSWLYKLKYLDKIRSRGDSCYTLWGTHSHDIIQGFYEDKYHEYEGMAEDLEIRVVEYLATADPKLKFPNEKEWENYIANIRHYFSNVIPIPYKIANEKAVLAVFEGVEKYVFQGYVDSQFTDELGNLVILDYKTSSMSEFTGKKLIKKARQLIIYAMGISHFHKIPMEKIKIRYDMMKYLNVSYMQKNGKIKVTKAERRLWVGKIANQIRKDLDKLGFDIIQVNEMVEEAVNANNLDNMPQEVQDKYTLDHCYIDVEITDEVLEEMESELVATLDKIIAKSKEDNLEEAFDRPRIENSDSYYCVNLCDMKEHCKYYTEFKDHQGMFLTKEAPSDDEILAMLGLG